MVLNWQATLPGHWMRLPGPCTRLPGQSSSESVELDKGDGLEMEDSAVVTVEGKGVVDMQ